MSKWVEYITNLDFWVLIVEKMQVSGGIQVSRNQSEICFREIPSLRDFLQVVKQTPWMAASWEEEIIPLVRGVEWPEPMVGEKRNQVDLVEGGVIRGRIIIERRQTWCNE